MNQYDYLIVGGGAAGVSAAETIRELDPARTIAIISDEPHPLYSRVLLPHFVKGLIPRERLFLRTTAEYQAKGITFRPGERVGRLDAPGRFLTLETGEEISFVKLLIASGGQPRQLGVPGEHLPGVSRFQTIEDADALSLLLPRTKHAVVVGSSFIALEYLDILARRRIPTTLVLRDQHFFGRHIDRAGADVLHSNFRRHGIDPIVVEDSVIHIEGERKLAAVRTRRGVRVECDFFGIGIGLEKNTAWLGSSGLTLTPRGIVVNEFLETSVPGIFAAGDAADFYDPISQTHHSHGNWSNSFLQGKSAARNMAQPEGARPFRSLSFYSIQNLDCTVAFIGATSSGASVEAVSRSDPQRRIYERFFLRRDQLVGAVLVNCPQEQGAISTLIRDGVPIPSARTRLADISFDIAELLR